jgi:hypothetical protein
MGSRKKARRKTASKPQSTYPLSEVKELVDQGKVWLKPNALQCAQRDFGWERRDILDALKKLKPGHFNKSDPSVKKPGVLLDIYKAYGLKGEDVYIHFYIDDQDGILVVNSFHGCR